MWGKMRISNHVCVLPSFGRGSFLRFPWNGIQASSCWDNRFNKMLINQEQNNTKPTKVSRIFKFSRDSGRCETNICLSSSLKFSPKIPKKNWWSFSSASLSMLSGRRDLSPHLDREKPRWNNWDTPSLWAGDTIGYKGRPDFLRHENHEMVEDWGLEIDEISACSPVSHLRCWVKNGPLRVRREKTKPVARGSDWTNKRCHKNGPENYPLIPSGNLT